MNNTHTHNWDKWLLIVVLLLFCVHCVIAESAQLPYCTNMNRVQGGVTLIAVLAVGVALIQKRRYASHPVSVFCYAMFLFVSTGTVAGILHHYGRSRAAWFWPFYSLFGVVLLSLLVLSVIRVFTSSPCQVVKEPQAPNVGE